MLICCIKKQCRVGYQAGKQFFTHDNFIKRDALALFTDTLLPVYIMACVMHAGDGEVGVDDFMRIMRRTTYGY